MKRVVVWGLAGIVACFLAACGGDKSSSEGVDTNIRDLVSLSHPRDILAAVFEEGIRHKPSQAVFGTDRDRSFDAVMDSLSEAEFIKHYERMAFLGTKLESIDIEALNASEQLAYDIASSAVQDAASRSVAAYETWEMHILYDESDDIPYYSVYGSIRNREDFDNLLSRYAELTRYYHEKIANYRRGMAAGRVAAKPLVERVIEKNRSLFSLSGEDSLILEYLTFDEAVTEEERAAWRAELETVVDNTVNPAGMLWVGFLENELLPVARTDTFGIGALDVGPAFYAGQVRFHTGDDRSAQALFELGEARVAELEDKLETELETLNIHEETLAAALEAFARLPQSAFATPEDIQSHVETILLPLLADAGWAGDVWGVANPAEVVVQPQYPSQVGTALYRRGGIVVVPTGDVALAALDCVLVHEYTHLLQEVVSKNDEAFSPVQSFFGSKALTEGAGLYSEVKALDAGFYEQTASDEDELALAATRVNALSALMLRAVRLVVDTGIHSQGWSRQEAIDYMKARLTSSEASIEAEVDRYAGFPGQALSYWVGLEAIQAAQDEAREALGGAFDEPAFNRMVLGLSGAGASLLKQKTELFIAGQ